MDSVSAALERNPSFNGVSDRAVQRVFFGIAALLFVVSTAQTIRWCIGMSMGEITMPGGWTMSMVWMRMCGQTWFDATKSFLAMWLVMMAAMMLPSLTPVLWRYYQSVVRVVDLNIYQNINQNIDPPHSLSRRERTGVRVLQTKHNPFTDAMLDPCCLALISDRLECRPELNADAALEEARVMRPMALLTATFLTTMASLGYFLMWAALGMAAYFIGVALTTMAMRMPALAAFVPLAAGLVVLFAGALQFTAWKSHRLTCCLGMSKDHAASANIRTAWRYGLHLGYHCLCCCAGLTAILFVMGIMDLRAMIIVTLAITIERLAPSAHAAKFIGVVIVAAGMFILVRAIVW
jgi:predicted metal-binding membrane protein